MYWKDHNPPHFHARYGEHEAIITIEDGLIQGTLPRRAQTMVLEWMSLHKIELIENWKRSCAGEEIKSIAPLE